MLRNMGLEVHQAWNGLEAIEQCKKTRYDLIFMDVQVCTTHVVRMRAGVRGTAFDFGMGACTRMQLSTAVFARRR